jgi:hypothetical protein
MNSTWTLIVAVSIVAPLSTILIIIAVNVQYPQSNPLRTPKHRTIVIEPVFTEAAYQSGGWYDNNKVTSVNLNYTKNWRTTFGGSEIGFNAINKTGSVDTTNDIEVTLHPEILQAYDKVILLHNEYVTKTEYYAIMSHPNVFYGYPNSLNRFVSYERNTTVTNPSGSITLIGYTGNPYSNAKWGEVNEFDRCSRHGYEVVEYPNGNGLSCYPERLIVHNKGPIDVMLGRVQTLVS